MKRSVYCLLALIVLTVSCKPTVPSSVIQPDDMEDLLYDYHIAQALATQQGTDDAARNFNTRRYFLSVLKKHDVTEADFDSSLVYYYSHVDRLNKIYTRVNERLAGEGKALGAKVGEIGRYSQYSATGDTANIWKETTDVLLMPYPTMNRYDFTVKADTSFYKGDSFMFQFMAEFLWQNGVKEATVCIVSKYEGDSIVQTSNHVSVAGIAQLRLPVNRENRLKEMSGFIYLSDGGDETDTRKMMFISQIQLIRFHSKHDNDTNKQGEADKTDSLQQSDNAGRAVPDTMRLRTFGRRAGGTPLPVNRGDAQNRVDAGTN